MKTPFLDSLRDALVPNRSVYVLINHTKRKVYFGVSKRTIERIMKEHSAGETDAIEGWEWESDDIVGEVLYSDLDQHSASLLAHALERYYRDQVPGYEVLQTAGI